MEKIKLAAGGVVPHDQMVLCGDDCREEILPAATEKIEYIFKAIQSIAYDMEMLMRELEVAAHE